MSTASTCIKPYFSDTMSSMKCNNQRGELNALLIPFILVSVLLVAVIVFTVSTYQKEQKYENHTNAIVKSAVNDATQQEAAVKEKEFAEREKQPLVSYTGPAQDGSIVVEYPKTWSAYVDASGNGNGMFDGYFQPKVVPADSGDQNAVPYALRIELINTPYDQSLQNYADNVTQNTVKVSPFRLKKVSNVVGSELTGQIQPNKKGVMIMLPLRGDTLEVWTESNAYVHDFNTYILPNLSFSP